MKESVAAPYTAPGEGTERAYLFMLASSLSFATMGALSHLAGERCDWRLVAVARTLVAFLLSMGLALSTGVRLVFFSAPRILWMRSLAGSIGLVCAFYALTHLPISTAITLSNTVPVWVTLLAWPALGQRPGGSVWLAILIGLVGIALVQRPELPGYQLAGLLAVGNALFTAVAMIGLNRLGSLDARAVVTHFSAVATIFTLAVLMLSGGAVDYAPLRNGMTLGLLAGVGAAGTLGQLAMTKAFALGSPSRVSVIGLMQVVFALVYDLLLWRRSFDALTFGGMFLVIAPSAWLILHNPLRKSTPIHTTN